LFLTTGCGRNAAPQVVTMKMDSSYTIIDTVLSFVKDAPCRDTVLYNTAFDTITQVVIKDGELKVKTVYNTTIHEKILQPIYMQPQAKREDNRIYNQSGFTLKSVLAFCGISALVGGLFSQIIRFAITKNF
jgi:hypothetical protein